MSSAGRIFSGAIIAMAGIAGNTATGLMFTFIVARLFGPSALGAYTFTLALIMLVATIGRAGMQSSVLKFVPPLVAQNRWVDTSKFVLIVTGFVFVAAAVLSLCCLPLVPHITRFFNKECLTRFFRVFLLVAPFLTVNMVLFFTFRAIRCIKYEAAYNGFIFRTIQVVFLFATYSLFSEAVQGEWIILFSLIFSQAAITGLSVWTLFTKTPLMFSLQSLRDVRFRDLKEALVFSMPLLFTSIMQFGLSQADILMLGYFLEEKDIGTYRVAIQVSIVLSMIMQAFGAVIAPMISEDYDKRDFERLRQNYRLSTYWITAVTAPFFILLLFFCKDILMAFGNDFEVATSALIVLASGQMLNAMTGQCGYLLILTGRQKLYFVDSLVSFMLNIILGYLLIPVLGILGAALSAATSISTVNLLRVAQVYAIYKIHPYSLRFFKPILVCVFIVLVMLGLRNYHTSNNVVYTAIVGSLFLTLYFSILIGLGLEREEKNLIDGLLNRFHIVRK